jgi:hypothetical protein
MDPKSLKRHDKLVAEHLRPAVVFPYALIKRGMTLTSYWLKNCSTLPTRGSSKSDAGSGYTESETLTVVSNREKPVRQLHCRVPTQN